MTTTCILPGCVALAVEGDPERRCAVHRSPGAKARPCPGCRGSGWQYKDHLCEQCGGSGYGTQHPSKALPKPPKEATP